MRRLREFENWEEERNRTEPSYALDARDRPEDYVWSTSEQARFRAFSLWIIRSVVQRHGGTVDIDLATDTINIDVPVAEQAACALEIEEQVGAMCR
ncbi:MAG: hypothetical protein SWH78_06430 [Thermodesulfobacteriota bacterium]|nr:hypothetical protein [Thermodesulfobacteriota bacterium]